MKGIFYKDVDEYQDKLDPITGYLEQLTHYIQVTKKLPLEQAKEVAKVVFRNNFKDKKVSYFERIENGDKVVEHDSFLGYITKNINSGNIIAPTLTTYLPAHQQKSILSAYTKINASNRGSVKKASQVAKADGNDILANSLNNEQEGLKINNNALSGIFSQKGSILYNPTAHSTLTSITRVITSLSNASNEQMIAGNRYLPRPIDALNHIVYVTSLSDDEVVKDVVSRFGLKVLTVENILQVLRRSTDLYFRNDSFYNDKIIPLLEKLTPEQLTFLGYAGDLYHIRIFNPEFMRKLIDELSPKYIQDVKLEDSGVVRTIDEAVLNYMHTIFYEEVKGKGVNYERMNEDGLANSIYTTSLILYERLGNYKDFFHLFIRNDVFPQNSYRLRNMKRRVVVLSDTDSTCCTLDEWIQWWYGDFAINDKTLGLSGLLSYIAIQTIVHKLAIFSKKMGVCKEELHTLEMKNEWLWTVHVPTNQGKHYFADAVYREGNVFAKSELEVKGVHLKNSAQPTEIIKSSDLLMQHICDTLTANKKLNLTSILKGIIEVEDLILSKIKVGDSEFFRRARVRSADAYKEGPERSPYQNHTFYDRVFSKKYGNIPPPPYSVVKFPTTLSNKTSLRTWIASLEEGIQLKLQSWLNDHNKSKLPTIYLNHDHVKAFGVPEEVMKVIDVKKIILDTTASHRTILESLGVILDPLLTVKDQFGEMVENYYARQDT